MFFFSGDNIIWRVCNYIGGGN